jgi:hypothetical protein
VSKFLGVVLAVQRAPDKGNKARGIRMPADNAMIGNAEFVNVLKTTD